MWREILALFAKELTLEWRNKYSLGGVLLFMFSTLFIVYQSFQSNAHPALWGGLWWIIMTFASLQAATRCFMSESAGLKMYHHFVARSESIYLSRTLMVILILLIVSFPGLLFFSITMGSSPPYLALYLSGHLLATMVLGQTFTFCSALAAQAANNSTLLSVLGLPLVLPSLLLAIQFTSRAMDGFGWDVCGRYVLALGAMNVLVAGLAIILFPYVWKE